MVVRPDPALIYVHDEEIPNNVHHYSVSNKGRVRNDRNGQVLSTLQFIKNDYRSVALHSRQFLVHHLVTSTFIPNPEYTNLEWASYRTNIERALGIRVEATRVPGDIGESHGDTRFFPSIVRACQFNWRYNGRAPQAPIPQATMNTILNTDRPQYGYTFRRVTASALDGDPINQ